jgi:hypothetical protein
MLLARVLRVPNLWQDDFNGFLWNVVMLAMGGSALGAAVGMAIAGRQCLPICSLLPANSKLACAGTIATPHVAVASASSSARAFAQKASLACQIAELLVGRLLGCA